jgi:hypothetical protein
MRSVAPLRFAWVGVLLMAVAGCAAPSPTPTVSPGNPQLVCIGTVLRLALDCHQALAVAIAALPQGDRPIRAVFEYGTYCGSTSGCGMSPQKNRADFGLVTFSFPGNMHQEYVYVVADAMGVPRLGGTLSSSPPPLMSVPTPIPAGNSRSLYRN